MCGGRFKRKARNGYLLANDCRSLLWRPKLRHMDLVAWWKDGKDM